MPQEEAGEREERVVACDPALHKDRQALAPVLVDHRHETQGPAVVGAFTDDVVGVRRGWGVPV